VPRRYTDPKGSEVYCAAVSPDGKLLAVGGEGRLLLFDPESQQLAAAFDETHKEAVSQVRGRAPCASEGCAAVCHSFPASRSQAPCTTSKAAVSEFSYVQVIWAPDRPATLVSASDDGLVAVFDFAEEVDEDDSWRAALNLDGAVARMGFYGASGAKLWMVSQLAGLHLWEWRAACSEDAAGALWARAAWWPQLLLYRASGAHQVQ
jgi:WD40 repeat protein